MAHPTPGSDPAPRPAQGHRLLPHTADLAIEAWAPSRAECLAEAVRALVSSFLDLRGTTAHGEVTVRFDPTSDDDLLVAVLEEVIYLVEVHGRVPVDAEVDEQADGSLGVRFALAGADVAELVGAVPKAVALHGLRFEGTSSGWRSHVTVDV